MLASTLVKYFPVAQDYAVEVPPQNPFDGVSRGLPISKTPEAHKSMWSKVTDIPEHVEQCRFPPRFQRDIESEIGENQRACGGVEEHDFIQRRRPAKEMLLDLSAPFHLRCVTEYVVEPKVRPLLRQTRGGINARLGV